MKTLGFGIVGCGAIAHWHGDAISKVQNGCFLGCADIDPARNQAFAGKYGGIPYSSFEDMLADDNIGAVSICTPSGLHAEYCILAAAAGKHIVVEKPMALTVEECDRIIEACQTYRVKLEVISQSRFKNHVLYLKNALEQGYLGKIVSADICMKFYRSPEYYRESIWKGTWKMDGGGALMNQGIHGVDLILFLMGKVKSVFGHIRTLARDIEVEDTASAVVEFQSGALGIIQGTTSVFPGYPRRLEINGNRGSVALVEGVIETWDVEGLARPATEVSAGASHMDPMAFSKEGHILQIQDLTDAVLQDRRPAVDQYEGKKPVELITAIYQSSRTGQQVFL